MNIRKATREDLSGIVQLFDGYRRFYEAPSDLEGARRFIAARLETGDSAIFVADENGTLVGFTQLYPSFSSVSMKQVWILNDLFVAPDQRRSGVGSALLRKAEEFARETAAKGLVLATQKTNTTAKARYDAASYKLDIVFDHYQRFF
jgi:GNAT superfamily N-acetyltransferase